MSKNIAATPKKPLPLAQPYQEGKDTFSIRARHKGYDIYLSGFKTRGAASKAAAKRRTEIDKSGAPKGRGPEKTSVAQALQDYAMSRLRFKKGAVQEAVRINNYLRAARLSTLVVTPLEVKQVVQEEAVVQTPSEPGAGTKKAKDELKPKTVYFKVELKPYADERVIPNGLHAHRKAQITKTAGAQRHRAILATLAMSEVTRDHIQNYMDAMRDEGAAPATLQIERSVWRVLFNHARVKWAWTSLADNPATELELPPVDNVRKRVMSLEEQTLMDASLADCRNSLIVPTTTLLRETAMRSSEPLQRARWRDVNWARQVLVLPDAKAGSREVPLSPVAIQALHALGPGEPDEAIINISYESLRAAWGRACERAGIPNLQIHDLRRTAATRLALRTGNRFLVKALTGHKTDVMVDRYIGVGADDVVSVFNTPEQPAAAVDAPENKPKSHAVPLPVAAPSAGFTPEQVQALVQQTVASTLAALQAPNVAVPGQGGGTGVPPLGPTMH
jgi:integrase